ncbi:tetratricopeptide repeat protein [Marinobacter confluentis]|uniref:tetratricopeptide repeat protein n=1 Tax=Marinobacter confluentis TaxID=1697557 RepID=UPI00143D0AB9|nr:tetratricopeptide repeat protein [Marinobacter confluentis]
MKYVPLPGLLVLLAVWWGGAVADSDLQPTVPEISPRTAFESGVAAFQSGNLQQARRLLEQARDAGLASSALLYNLGVVYYRLGLYDQASAAFTPLLDSPHAPLARYNLGLVLQKQGDTEAANAWFSQAAGDSAPREIQLLAQRQLASGGSSSATSTSASAAGATRTVVFLSAATGYDNNIAGAPSDATSDQAGAFGDLLASGRAYLGRGEGRAIRLEAVALARQYPSESEFDNLYLSVGAGWQQPLGAARFVSDLRISRFWFGGDLLEQQVSLGASYNRPGCFWPEQLMVDCKLAAFVSTIQGGSDFSAYDGALYGGEISAGKSLDLWRFDGAWRLEFDRRDDLEVGEEFFSLSPVRQTLSVVAERQITDRLSLGAEPMFRSSRYADPHRVISGGQLISRTRDDEQFRTRVFAGYRLDRRWQLGLDLVWVDNRSTLGRYQYDRGELMLSLDGVF